MSDERDASGRFQPGRSGNPKGRPAGARNKASLLVETLLAGAAERLTEAAIRMATEHEDPLALKLCLERLMPPFRNRTVRLPSRQLRAGDAVGAAAAMADIYAAATRGEITPAEAESLANVVLRQVDVSGVRDLALRIAELERAREQGKKKG